MGNETTPRSVVNLDEVLASIPEPWMPHTVAVVNDYDVRVAKVEGEFIPHRHPETDELFLVLKGGLTLRMEAGDVHLGPGDTFVVPKGTEHQPVAEPGTQILMVEPSETPNTGDQPGERTQARRVVGD
ncbi:cupin [cyanobacterium TDX16]|nr:cupin [cyanobacterium TDX16]